MKTAISIPDELFAAADALAARFGLSRSELYQKALADYLGRHRGDAVTAALDDVYRAGGETGRLDPLLAQLQAASLPQEDW